MHDSYPYLIHGRKIRDQPPEGSDKYEEMQILVREFVHRYEQLQVTKQRLQDEMDAEFSRTQEIAYLLLKDYGKTWRDLATHCGVAMGTVNRTLKTPSAPKIRLSSGGFPRHVEPERKTDEEMRDESAFPNLTAQYFEERGNDQ